MSSAEHPKALVLLFLIHCSLLPLLFCFLFFVCLCVWGGGMCEWVGVIDGFVLHYLVSSFAIIWLGKKTSWLLNFNFLLMSFGN